jgi:hypothetical protein
MVEIDKENCTWYMTVQKVMPQCTRPYRWKFFVNYDKDLTNIKWHKQCRRVIKKQNHCNMAIDSTKVMPQYKQSNLTSENSSSNKHIK